MNQMVRPANLRGYKGGSGGSQRQPVEAPDSLIAREQIRILDLVGEGDIHGLVDGINSIYLDEAPGSSYPSLQWDYRLGTQDQPYMPGFPAVESETNVGVTLLASAPYVRAVTNLSVTALRLNFALGRFAQQNPSNGDTTGVRVEFAIDMAQGAGGAFQEVMRSAFDGKTTSGYSRSVRIDLTYPAPAGGWRIQVRRLTPNATTGNVADTVTIRSVTEIIDYKFRYPNSALIGLNFDAEAFGGKIPKRAYHIKGRIVRVPTNYDPGTRTYAGIWDGSFKPAWTNNPVWVYYDLILHERYGLGDRITADQIDKWGLYEISQYCDQLVDDGKGGQEPRFTCNMFLQKQADALRVLQDLASVFRGITYWGLGQAVVSADMPRDPVWTYTNANVRGGRFDRKGSKKSTIYSAILSAWSDPADFYRTKYEYVQDDALVAKYGVRSTTLANIGCTSQGQAHRAAKWALLSNQYDTNTVTFSVGLEGIKAMPGQVVRIVDQHRQGRRVGGRVRDGSTTSRILVDLLPNINVAVGDQLVLNMPDGTSAVRTVSALDHQVNAVTVSAPFPALPVRGAVWAYEAEDLKSELYRIVSVSEGSTPLEYNITALTYTEGKHSAIDNGTIISSRPTVSIPTAIVPAPQNVRLTSDYKVDQYQAVTTLTIAWDAVVGAVRYDVEWRRDNGDWIYAGRVASTEVDVIGIYAGLYGARVRAINAVGILSTWAEVGPVELQGKTTPPPVPVGVTATSEIFAIRLEWGFPVGAEDTAFTQIQMAENAEGTGAINMGQFSYPTSMYLHTGMAAGVYRWFRLRLIDKTGNVGEWTNWVVGQSSAAAGPILDYIQGQITETELGQELLGRIDLIDGTGPGSVKDRLDDLRSELETQLTDLDLALDQTNINLNSINNNLQQQINDIADLADSMPYKADSTYVAGQAVLGANGKLYQANQDVPINTPPPNATYWDDIGQVVKDAGALAARVTTVETAITDIDGELSAQSSRIDGVQSSLVVTNQTVNNLAINKADASTVTSLSNRVTAAEGTIASQGQAITGLTNSLGNKADASALTALTTRVSAAEGNIASQSDSITSLNTRINDIGGDNMLPNSSFEELATPTRPKYWMYAATTSGTVGSIVDSTLPQSTKALRMDHPALPANGYIDVTYYGTDGILRPKVRENSEYILSVWARGTASMQFRLYIQWVNSSGAVISAPVVIHTITGVYQRFSLQAKAPVGAVGAQVWAGRLYNNGSGTVACWFEVDNVQFQEGMVATAYTPSGEQNAAAQAAATSALSVRMTAAEGTLTSQGNAITSLTNTVSGKADASALTALSTRVTAAEDSIASQGASITAITSVLGQQPDNLILKGTFEDGTVGPWTSDPLIANITAHPSYSKAIQFMANSFCGTTRNIITRGGEEFDCSADIWNNYMSSGQTTRLQIQFYDKNIVSLGYFTAFVCYAGANGFQTYSGRVTAPAGAVSARFVIRHETTDGIGRSLWCNIVARRITAADSANAAATTALTTRVTAAEGTLTSVSSSITQLNAGLSAIGGDNMLPNSSFETLAAGSTTTTAWWVAASTVAGLVSSIVDSTLPQSTKAQRISHSAIPANGYAEIRGNNTAADRIKVKGGSPYVLTSWVRGTPTFGMAVRQYITFYDAAGAAVGTPTSVGQMTDQFTRYTLATTAPATATTALVYAARILNGTGATSAIWMEVDNVQFQEGVTPTAYSPSTAVGLDANATAISALDARVSTAENTISSHTSSITQLNTAVAGKADNSALTALQSTVTSQGTTITSQGQAVTALQSTVGAIAGSGSNLLSDEYSWLTSTTLPAVNHSSGMSKAGVAISGSDSGYGISVSGMASAGHYVMFSPTNNAAGYNISITPGVYLVSMYVTASASGSMRASLYDGASRQSVDVPYTTSRTRITLPITVNDTTRAALTLYPNRTVVAGLTVNIDSIMVEKRIGENNTPSPFVAGPSARALTAQASALNSLTTTVTQQGNTITAQGQSITGLQTSLGNTDAQVSTMNTALTTLQGQASATNTIRVGIASNGTRYTAGYGVGISNANGVVQSTFAVLADQFAVMHSTAGVITTPFAIRNGQVFINDALISNLAVTNALVGQSLSSQSIASWAGLPTTILTFAGDGALVFRHPTMANTYTTYTVNGIDMIISGVRRFRAGTW